MGHTKKKWVGKKGPLKDVIMFFSPMREGRETRSHQEAVKTYTVAVLSGLNQTVHDVWNRPTWTLNNKRQWLPCPHNIQVQRGYLWACCSHSLLLHFRPNFLLKRWDIRCLFSRICATCPLRQSGHLCFHLDLSGFRKKINSPNLGKRMLFSIAWQSLNLEVGDTIGMVDVRLDSVKESSCLNLWPFCKQRPASEHSWLHSGSGGDLMLFLWMRLGKLWMWMAKWSHFREQLRTDP